MWKGGCETAERFIAEENKYNKQMLQENGRLICGTIHYHQIDRENAVEVRPTEEFSRKHPVFPVFLVKAYYQKEEDKFPSRTKSHAPQDIVEVEGSLVPVEKIMQSRRIRLKRKDHRHYLVRFKN
ncbi:hypothetical protein O181_019764 [Austropuccinia psidii MF-1]|uniref:Uncharacterized protein n=1 Tax=Austropuccinia psidii MF-1 TaxID=1389203 RepID=A0A9Q3CA68_9BASI|nr:hypothetical protein [Austropuccinia psidii MF-1]